MPAAKRFQFSLRTYLIACTLAAVAVAIVVWQFQAHDRWERSISKVDVITAANAAPAATHDSVQVISYEDHRRRPVAYVFLMYDEYIPNVPAIARSYDYTRRTGGRLFVDGEPVDPAEGPLLFVNGPYGYTAQWKISEQEVEEIETLQGAGPGLCFDFWRRRVEPRLYRVTGQAVAGLRDGRWEYRLANDALYVAADYQLGVRHGDWTTYYPSGQVQCRAQFQQGQPEGRWQYFDETGELLGSLELRNGTPQNQDKSVLHFGRAVTYFHSSGRRLDRTSFRIDDNDTDGAKFFLYGREVQRPKLDFPLLIAPQQPAAIASGGN
jgi:hypothetical protein